MSFCKLHYPLLVNAQKANESIDASLKLAPPTEKLEPMPYRVHLNCHFDTRITISTTRFAMELPGQLRTAMDKEIKIPSATIITASLP